MKIVNLTALLQFMDLLQNSENFVAQDISMWINMHWKEDTFMSVSDVTDPRVEVTIGEKNQNGRK